MMTDPIADMLTRIRNCNKAYIEQVEIPSSKMKVAIAKILKAHGYIKNYNVVEDNKQNVLVVYLKFDQKGERVISELKRISTPGRKVYVDKDSIPVVRNGLGIAILSTSKGVFTDKEAREQGLGGEVVCSCW
jgi:small subunit ribosomal protein S8